MTTPASSGTVLLIDDEEDFRKVIAWRLEREGNYRVLTAPDGPAGLVLASQHHPDAVLVDFTMPKMNGHAVLKSLKDDSGTKDIPVIMLTSMGEEQKVAESISLGAMSHMAKWSDAKQLLDEVKMAVARHRAAHPDA
ncbi:MAG TPA: response regulator [bacterium]